MFFESRGYLKRLPKYGRREQNALWRFGSYLLSILSDNAKNMAGAILEGHLRIPIVSYCLLRAPLAPVVACWLLLPLLGSCWFPLAPPCTF